MAKIAQTTLSPVMMPKGWPEKMLEDGLKQSSGIFAFDCFQTAEGVELICRIEDKHFAFLDGLTFEINGQSVEPIRTPTPRGSRLFFKGTTTEQITVSGHDAQLDVAVNPTQNALFADQNTMFTIAVEPSAEVLVDWLNFHHEEQGAEAALVLVRSGPEYDLTPLQDALEKHANKIKLNTICLASCDLPLGHPDMPAETSRHLAPDAPGKAMLPQAEPDLWRSPIFELAILEVARRRFLKDTRAVLYCQPHDLVLKAEVSVFDAAHHSGFIKFQGKRAYPYALNAKKPPRHGDHNCVSFDGKGAENIWCAAPSKMEPDAFWRQFRISNVEPVAGHDFTYWRCMALRHPQLKVAELVPKSSLVLDDGLAELVKTRFKANPKAPPSVKKLDPSQFKNDKILIVTTMKNEGPFILEWLAYHRAIGVTDFLVYTNDCTDGTEEMFDLLEAKGILQHAENPYREMDLKPQHAAFQAAETTEIVEDADWVICMDVDEFINVHVGDGTLKALFDTVPDATLISLTWRLFGNADISEFEDRPMIEQFDQCAPALCRKPHQAWGFKTLFRNLDHYKKFGVHRPKGLKPEYLDQIKWVNGSGLPMPDKMLRTGWRSSTSTVGYDLVSLNHYSLRSAESFLVKRDRGRVNHVDRDQGLAYWFRMNHNAQRETSISNKLPRFRKELARLMDDPDIAEMHARCVKAHRLRIDELLTSEEYQNLYKEITGDRLRALSKMLHNFGNQTFLDGPDAIPQDFHLTD